MKLILVFVLAMTTFFAGPVEAKQKACKPNRVWAPSKNKCVKIKSLPKGYCKGNRVIDPLDGQCKLKKIIRKRSKAIFEGEEQAQQAKEDAKQARKDRDKAQKSKKKQEHKEKRQSEKKQEREQKRQEKEASKMTCDELLVRRYNFNNEKCDVYFVDNPTNYKRRNNRCNIHCRGEARSGLEKTVALPSNCQVIVRLKQGLFAKHRCQCEGIQCFRINRKSQKQLGATNKAVREGSDYRRNGTIRNKVYGTPLRSRGTGNAPRKTYAPKTYGSGNKSTWEKSRGEDR